MRKLSVVSAFALLLVNPCLSIASTPQPTKISAFCRNELQKTLAQSYQVALQFDKETKDKKREFHPSHPIAYTYAELGDFDRALDVAKSISNRYRQDETLGAIGGQYIKINQLE